MKNILIPYDFSQAAINALNYTKQLFDGLAVNIYLLDVYIGKKSRLISNEKNNQWFRVIDDEIEDELKFLITILNKENKEFNYQGLTAVNSLSNAVKDVITEKNIDLIISGTKGAKSLTETFLGTNTIKIINAVDTTPVLVVPTIYKYKRLHQIMFSTNYKRMFYKNELEPLVYLSTLKNSSIEVINLSEEKMLNGKQKDHKEKLKILLEDPKISYKKLDWENSEKYTLAKYIEDSKSQLLVLINHKHHFFYHLTEENVLKKIVFNSSIPILILPELT